MREGAELPAADERPMLVEEYWERRVQSAAGLVVERQFRQMRWGGEATPSTREVMQAAAPILRALALAMAPAVGRLAVRALAPRLLAALPRTPVVLPAVRRRRRVLGQTAAGRVRTRVSLPAAPKLPALPPGPAERNAAR